MYNQRVIDQGEIPLPPSQRKQTDVFCCCLHVLSLLALLTAATITLVTHPNMEKEMRCSSSQFQMWLQANNTRVCVDRCPEQYTSRLDICFPLLEDQLNIYLQQSQLQQTWDFSVLFQVMLGAIVLAFSFGIFLLSFAYLCSSIFPYILTIFLIILTAGVATLTWYSQWIPSYLQPLSQSFNVTQNSLIITIFGSLALIALCWMACFCREFSWNGSMISTASTVLAHRPSIVFLTMIFQLLSLVALAKCCFQLWVLRQTKWLVICCVVEFLWNLQYCKDAYHLLLSWAVTEYYWKKDFGCYGFHKIWQLHYGSIAGGSALNLILTIPHLFLDNLCCHPDDPRPSCALSCTSLSGLARTDSYAYMAIAGIPYCNSARQCRQVTSQSILWSGNSSPLSTLRLAAHILMNLLVVIWGSDMILQANSSLSWSKVGLLWVISQVIGSWTLDCLLHMGEAVQINLLIELQLGENHLSVKQKPIFQTLERAVKRNMISTPFLV